MPLDRITTALPPVVLRRVAGDDHVLTPEALAFVAELQARFGLRLHALMVARTRRQARTDAGEMPDYLPDTRDIRQGIWQASPVPAQLADRRVEITGPVDRKMMINALNSGARVFMADFEDATAPSFTNIIAGHANLLDYRDGTLEHQANGKSYSVNADAPLLIVRPRGLHLAEANVLIGGQPVSAALFDFGLSLFHCGRAFAATGRGPFYYLPKLESHGEARFWNEVFTFAQDRIGLAQGTIKATVLIETLHAAFQMDEIIWELRDHIAGLNCGRWDYIFSYIKTMRNHAAFVLPDRAEVTMDQAFLASYAARLVKVCHRRGIHAMGGMSAAIPVRDDAEANEAAFAQVRADKLREVGMGFDGCWVAHPDLVPVAQAIFDAEMPGPNQIRKPRQEWRIEPAMLLRPHQGKVTQAGVETNIAVAIEYLAQWLSGRGAVPIHNLMEDAATAEISRAQLWQWQRHRTAIVTHDGAERPLDSAWLGELVQAEILRLLDRHGPNGFHRGHYASAARIVLEAATAPELPDFITTPAYAVLNALD
ncbi:malate synthase A [Paracoccus shanxieyensis]|uniref:Malate synthase n=1 Tax=Paracoccus shanxieyensis TaxID=2675752 RepID=A0A6L6IU84_9RHOB|nr:malate synthase A [Paracoccus shanxieyensis]MTH64036.1 malate synthase A [Paracoccus shanxieyensis]MTH86923.1 malate synthase A [Paracoccus shanxieyensis]